MKKLFFIIGILALFSCASIQPATSYSHTLRKGQGDNVGKITYVIEKRGYSIITIENMVAPLYIEGRLPIKKPYKDVCVWIEYNRKGEIYRYNFIYDGRRYKVDTELTNS